MCIATTDSEDGFGLGSEEPSCKIDIMDSHIDELTSAVTCVCDRTFDTALRVLRIPSEKDRHTYFTSIDLRFAYAYEGS